MSADFDPRILWDRRQILASGAALSALAPGAGFAASQTPAPGQALLVTGAEIPAETALRMARAAGAYSLTLPAQSDPVRVWAARIAPFLRDGVPLMGVTSWADSLVLRGQAAETRRRLHLEIAPGARPVPRDSADPALAAQARLLSAALAAGTPDSAGLIGWILN